MQEANRRNMANNYEMETHEELPNNSELTKNSEPMSETSKSIVEKQQFPPKTQQSQQTTAKQTKGKVNPPMKELKKHENTITKWPRKHKYNQQYGNEQKNLNQTTTKYKRQYNK